MSEDGLITLRSNHDAQATMDRLDAAVRAAGLTVFAQIDHAAGAAQAGLSLRPTAVLVFGNARGGTPLMQQKQTIGIDLPLKVLVWEDADGAVWLAHDDPRWLARRHGLGAGADAVTAAMAAALVKLTQAAASP